MVKHTNNRSEELNRVSKRGAEFLITFLEKRNGFFSNSNVKQTNVVEKLISGNK